MGTNYPVLLNCHKPVFGDIRVKRMEEGGVCAEGSNISSQKMTSPL